ncbi:PGG domain [Macleaya cordata]|uniref:PGG domain n=1 Tax=Macleaya cordata TaxID=56857 RepID=A0A200Q5R1_MACCD|nr:PGG domain [Macleaya cordata]
MVNRRKRLRKEELEKAFNLHSGIKRKQHQKETMDRIKEVSTIHLLVATLIATVTFAAGFTLPGGYNTDGPHKGMATLIRRSAFIAFVVSNSVAMIFSTFAVFIHFWSNFIIKDDNQDVIKQFILTTIRCTFFAIIAMMVAFVTGTYAVLSHSRGLAIFLCVLNCSFFPLCVYIFRKMRKRVIYGLKNLNSPCQCDYG